jgi:lysophospholipase L1-like esterase
MQIALGLGIGLTRALVSSGPLPPQAPTVALSILPASPVAGDLVTLSAAVAGNPLPTDFSALSISIAGSAMSLTGTGLQRRFVARGGALSASATVTNTEGSGSTTLSASVTPGVTLASVVGFGSSTMEGDGASATATRALNLSAGVLGAATIRNQGLAGTVLQNSPDSSGSARAGNGRDRFVAALLGANKSDRAFLLYGANDLRYTGAPATFNLAGFANDLREVLNGMLTGGYARSEIVLASPNWYPDTTYAIGGPGFTGSDRSIHESYVSMCSQIAAEYGLLYADVYAKMRDLGGEDLMSADGLHANDAGHQVVAHAFLSAVPANSHAAAVPGAASMSAPSTLQLAWSAVPGATGYLVEAGLEGSYAYTVSASTSAITQDFTGLAAGNYRGRVRAEFGDGPGPWAFWSAAVAISDGSGSGRVITGQDSFIGQTPSTVLTDLPADLGTWMRHSLSTGNAATTTDGNAVRGPSSTSQFMVATINDQPLGAGVFVEMDFLIRSNSAQLTTYAVARATSSELTFLAAGYNGSAWRILKYVAGAVTVVGTYSLTEAIGATPLMRFEVQSGVQRLYRNDVLVLTTTEADAGLGSLGNGLGVRLGAGSTAWSSSTGGQITGLRVGTLPA